MRDHLSHLAHQATGDLSSHWRASAVHVTPLQGSQSIAAALAPRVWAESQRV